MQSTLNAVRGRMVRWIPESNLNRETIIYKKKYKGKLKSFKFPLMCLFSTRNFLTDALRCHPIESLLWCDVTQMRNKQNNKAQFRRHWRTHVVSLVLLRNKRFCETH